MLDIKTIELAENIRQVELNGELNNTSTNGFLEVIEEMMRREGMRIILDFSHVSMITSAGIGAIGLIIKDLRESTCVVCMILHNEQVLTLLRTTHLLGNIQVFKTLDGAMDYVRNA